MALIEKFGENFSSSPIKNSSNENKMVQYRSRVNFSLHKEIFFVTISSLIGAIAMFVPRIIFDVTINTQYYIAWLVFARILDSDSYLVGIGLHFVIATTIGIITGIILHKGIKFNISKLSNGLIYGVISGIIVYFVFFMPVQYFVLGPNMVDVLMEINPTMSFGDATSHAQNNISVKLLDSYFTHLIWGISVGVIASLLTRKLGANFRCHKCDVEFLKIETYHKHHKLVHDSPLTNVKKIVILGGGYAGVSILRKLQKEFEDDVNVSISIVSQDNFFLHTPMLPEMATGVIEPRHIATPIRAFCKRARFYQSRVDSIDTTSKQVIITRTFDNKKSTLDYDYLVLTIGNKTNFFGNENIQNNSLTIKTLGDAIGIRNHVISMLENADQEDDPILQEKFVTFVVVGGGFSGVETVGELNDFVRESTEKFYRNIDQDKIKVILISAKDTILPEIGELGKYAFESLTNNGVEIITTSKVVDAGKDFTTISDGRIIPTRTIIWAGGNKVDSIITNLDTEHDRSGRIVVDKLLRLKNHPNIFALGDCASIMDEKTGKPYPPTAQHAIREAKVATGNITANLRERDDLQKEFDYESKGSMAKIGKRDGVALMLGHKFQGITAWFLWKQYYLATLPLTEKKIRVAFDWFIDLFFSKDITRLSELKERSLNE